ncbi:MAG: hypothetical protein MZU95_16820 [Desulfomicrobium escambiense]|nr:hypothetical protein [Desulfomicrobium escambiense]
MLDSYQVFVVPRRLFLRRRHRQRQGPGQPHQEQPRSTRSGAFVGARHADAGDMQRLPGDGRISGSFPRSRRVHGKGGGGPGAQQHLSGTSAGGWTWRSSTCRRRCSRRGIDRLHIPVAHGEGNFYALGEDAGAHRKGRAWSPCGTHRPGRRRGPGRIPVQSRTAP